MTPEQWLRCRTPAKLLQYLLRNNASERKLRLFACACCRHFQRGLDLDDRLTRTINAAEECAEGRLDRSGLEPVRAAAAVARREDPSGDEVGLLNLAVVEATAGLAARKAVEVVTTTYAWLCVPCESFESAQTWMKGDIVSYLRDIFGDPFQPLPARSFPAHVLGLAQTCYDAFPAISSYYPILADALAELGEERAALHCREKRHAKGCHVLDWILARE